MMNERYGKYGVAAFVSLATLLVYLRTLGNGFVNWDDNVYVYDNFNIRTLSGTFFHWAFTSFHAGNWHPLTWVSHALDYALWGLNPLGHHLTSVIIHGMNTFVSVVLCARLLEVRQGRDGARPAPFLQGKSMLAAAGTAGLLFGLHPLHVESVAWLSERKDLLCGFFFLLSILAYLSYASLQETTPSPGRDGNRTAKRTAYLASLAFFILALLSKPMAVSLPVVLLLLDRHPLQRFAAGRFSRSVVVEKIPFVLLSMISSVLTIVAQQRGGAVSTLTESPFSDRLLVAAKAVMVYLLEMAVPIRLLPFSVYPKQVSLLSPDYLASVLILCGLTAACLALIKRGRTVPVVWGYYLVTLLPVLGLLQIGNQAMADRYTYLPSLGPFLLAGLGVSRLRSRAGALKGRAGAAIPALGVLLLALVMTMASLTWRQIAVWQDSITLWSTVIAHDPRGVPLAYTNRGLAFREQGQSGRAMEDFTAAITIDPAFPSAYNSRGALLSEAGRQRDAIRDYTTALALEPGDPAIYNNRGIAFMRDGRTGPAIEDFSAAISLDPGYAKAYNNRGKAYGAAGRIEPALADYRNAVAADPYFSDAYHNRALVLGQQGQLEAAILDFTQAIELNPSGVEAYCNRAVAYGRLGRIDQALADYGRAAALRPGFAQAYLGRGELYEKQGSPGQALQEYQRACALGEQAACKAFRALERRRQD